MSPTAAERPARFGFSSIVGSSPALREAMAWASKVAQSRSTVLLVGPTGTGKDLFARGIHYDGPTAGEPFVAVNCAAIPAALLESELFGHERGAFTDARSRKLGLLELAGNGTLFLDELGELPLELQPKLLRVLEERRTRRLGGTKEVEISCRIIAATNASLEDAVARGEFREDLFYRLNVFRIVLPRLSEREGDVEILARHFLRELARNHGAEAKQLSPDAVTALRLHAWPGNVRELKNVLERAILLCDGPVIQPEHLLIQRRTVRPAAQQARDAADTIEVPAGGKALEEIEREAIRIALRHTGGNKSAAARFLRISRPTLVRKMEGLDEPGQPPGDRAAVEEARP